MIRRWREVERWIEDQESEYSGSFPERALSDFIARRIQPINRAERPLDVLNVVAKISFGGDLHVRSEKQKRGYKGPLFEAFPGDLVISKIRVAQGSLCVVPATLDHLAVSPEYPVYMVDRNQVRAKFLHLVIRTAAFEKRVGRLRSGNTTKARIRPVQFEALRIPLPSLDEQDALIDAYNSALHNAAEMEAKAEAIERSGWEAFEAALGLTPPPPLPDRPVFVARFKDVERWSHEGILRSASRIAVRPHSWSLARLGDLVADLENGWSPKCHDRPAHKGKWAVLKLGAVSFGIFNAAENKELPSGLKPRPGYEVKAGDVLISRANVVRYVGACAYVRRTPPKLMLCDKIFRVCFLPESRLLPQFLAEAMKLQLVREHIEAHLTGTSPTMKNISKPALLDIQFPLPSVEVQRHLVAKILCGRRKAARMRKKAKSMRSSAWAGFESALFTGANAS